MWEHILISHHAHFCICAGATMEVNISHRNRQEILTTPDLAHPDLFNNALNELLQLMKMVGSEWFLAAIGVVSYYHILMHSFLSYFPWEKNLAKDYWSSMFFKKLREDGTGSNGHELEVVTGWNYSPRLSCVHGEDDPFHEEHPSKSSAHDTNTQDVEQQWAEVSTIEFPSFGGKFVIC